MLLQILRKYKVLYVCIFLLKRGINVRQLFCARRSLFLFLLHFLLQIAAIATLLSH